MSLIPGSRGGRRRRRLGCGGAFAMLLGIAAAIAAFFWATRDTATRGEAEMTYEEALQRTDPAKVGTVEPGSAAAQAALDRFRAFFGSWTEDSVRSTIRDVYAADVFFNDTLKTVVGIDALEKYLATTARAAESITVRFDDVVESRGDTYVRWTMDVRLKRFQRGRTLRSVGMTHLRFDADGRVVLHKDFWDAAGGFFEHLPVVGRAIRWIKSQV